MKRIVVLGGGFGGVAAAQRLDRAFRYDDEVEIEVVSDTNYVVYTPMLVPLVRENAPMIERLEAIVPTSATAASSVT